MRKSLPARIGATLVLVAAFLVLSAVAALAPPQPTPLPAATSTLQPTAPPSLATKLPSLPPAATPIPTPTATVSPTVDRLNSYILQMIPILASFSAANTTFGEATKQYGALKTKADLEGLRTAATVYNQSMQKASRDLAAVEPPPAGKPVHDCFRRSFDLAAQGAMTIETALGGEVDEPKLAQATSAIDGAGNQVLTCTQMIQTLKTQLP